MQCVSLPKLSQSIGSKWCSPRSGTTGNSLVGAYTVLQVDPDQTPPVKVDWYGHALLSSHHQNSDTLLVSKNTISKHLVSNLRRTTNTQTRLLRSGPSKLGQYCSTSQPTIGTNLHITHIGINIS